MVVSLVASMAALKVMKLVEKMVVSSVGWLAALKVDV